MFSDYLIVWQIFIASAYRKSSYEQSMMCWLNICLGLCYYHVTRFSRWCHAFVLTVDRLFVSFLAAVLRSASFVDFRTGFSLALIKEACAGHV
jgi:hypothetical protein